MPPRNLLIIAASIFVSILCFVTARRVQRTLVIGDALALIDRYYVDPVEAEQLVEAAMKGMTSELDSHSEFIPADRYIAFTEHVIQQEFAGVGILVEQPEPGEPVRVVTPLVGSPALEAGIRPGDKIVAVGGDDVSKLDIREVSNRLRGPVGTEVLVTVRRRIDENEDEERTRRIDIRLQRRTIALESVVGDHRDADDRWVFRLRDHPRIAYVRITSFGERTASDLRRALTGLNNDFDSMILDVRGNAGGLLTSAVEVCDDFIASGRIVTIRGRGGVDMAKFDAGPKVLVRQEIPLVVMIDGYSASASEIVAACLQDHGRATIVGARSFGKGTVQNLHPLEAGRSALKLTTARYYRPNGRNIHRIDNAPEEEEWGVRPDDSFEVKMDEELYLKLVEYWHRAGYPVSSSAPIDDEVADPQLKRAVEALLPAQPNPHDRLSEQENDREDSAKQLPTQD